MSFVEALSSLSINNRGTLLCLFGYILYILNVIVLLWSRVYILMTPKSFDIQWYMNLLV